MDNPLAELYSLERELSAKTVELIALSGRLHAVADELNKRDFLKKEQPSENH